MKKHKIVLLISLFLIAFGLTGCAQKPSENASAGEEKEKAQTYADRTQIEAFQEVPVMVADNTGTGQITDYGDNTYVVDVNGTTLEQYQAYLTLLEEEGFTKYVDNGETGLEEALYSATYTKDNLVVTVFYVVNLNKTYIAAKYDLPLSEHLHYKEEYLDGNVEGAQTTLHMRDMIEWGNSFVIQLKNGHFIMNDGGKEGDVKYLVEYLESLVPAGEKPVIEAWFISHSHTDHMELFQAFSKDLTLAKRVYVEGIYYNQPSNTVVKAWDPASMYLIQYVPLAAMSFKTTEGTSPQVYRPQPGQRYYFNDIIIDIPFAQEMLILENGLTDLNETSTWMMYNIEGQKFLLIGDADEGSMKTVMRTFDSDYFELDIYAVAHHGINVYDYWTDYCSIKTLLYPNIVSGSRHVGDAYERAEENAHLRESALEYMSYGDGTKVLTFPYKVGTAQYLPQTDWKYHPLRGMEE